MKLQLNRKLSNKIGDIAMKLVLKHLPIREKLEFGTYIEGQPVEVEIIPVNDKFTVWLTFCPEEVPWFVSDRKWYWTTLNGSYMEIYNNEKRMINEGKFYINIEDMCDEIEATYVRSLGYSSYMKNILIHCPPIEKMIF